LLSPLVREDEGGMAYSGAYVTAAKEVGSVCSHPLLRLVFKPK
jgi:hypothetical protein